MLLKFISDTGLVLIACNGFSQSGWVTAQKEFMVETPRFKTAHASTLVEASPNNIMVSFSGGSYEGNKDIL